MQNKIFSSEQNQNYKEKLMHTLELMELGMSLMRQNLKRRNPEANEVFIDSEMKRWLMQQPYCFFTSTKP